MPHLLEGEVLTGPSSEELERLQDENDDLRRELREAKAEVERATRHAAHAVSALRRQLAPLYKALQMVFGELETIQTEGEDRPDPLRNKSAAIWESWKQKMPGMAATFITILLEHGEMNAAQLRVAARCGNQTVYDTIHRLNKVGLIVKNGGRFSLRQL